MSPGFSRLLVHVLFSTKRQEPYLADENLRAAVHRSLADTCRALRGSCLAVGGTADHVHIFAQVPAPLAIADLVRELKRESFVGLKVTHPELARFHWQAGYGAFTVSASKAASVRRYVHSQPEHHRNLSFRDEFRSLLDRHKLPYDEATLWD